MADTRIDELRRRLERDPGSRLFAQLAEELRKSGELVEAIRVARAGLAEHPSYPSARLTLGRALLDSSDAAGARAELEHTLREAPDNILASRFLAQAREALGDLKGAVEQYEKTLQMSPGDAQLQAQLAAVAARLRGQGAAVTGAASGLPATVRIQTAGPSPAPAPPVAPPVLAAPPVQPAAPPPPPPPPLPPPPAPPPPSAARAADATRAAPAGPGEDMWFAEAAAEPATLVDPAQSAPTVSTQAFSAAPSPAPAAPAPAPAPRAAQVPPPAPANAGPVLASTAGAGSAPFSSSTLAELYLQQGLVDRAVDVYRQLVQQEPGNEKARLRLVELETASVGPEERAARRLGLERTIAGLEQLLAAVQRR